MIPQKISKRLLEHWFSGGSGRLGLLWRLPLLVVEGVYLTLLGLREAWFGWIRPPKKARGVRVIAVGNLVVGGAGKTPVVMAMAEAFRSKGVVCGILTRGYGSTIESNKTQRAILPEEIRQTTAQQIGDEAWLLAWRTQCPIGVGANRYQSLLALRARVPDLDVVILDDGLQQRSLQCDERYLVIDSRGFGNGHCLPYGPLREPAIGLGRWTGWIDHGLVDALTEGRLTHDLPSLRATLKQTETAWISLAAADQSPPMDLHSGLLQFKSSRILAAAGIAMPEKFFAILDSMGLTFDRLPLPDHEPLVAEKILNAWKTSRYDYVLMTEKDAVKMMHRELPFQSMAWALRRTATLNTEFINHLTRGH